MFTQPNCQSTILGEVSNVSASRTSLTSVGDLAADDEVASDETDDSVTRLSTSITNVPACFVAGCTLLPTPEGSYVEAYKISKGSVVRSANGSNLTVVSVASSTTKKLVKLDVGDISLLVTHSHLVCVDSDDNAMISSSCPVRQAGELVSRYKENTSQVRICCSDGVRVLTGAEELLLLADITVLDIRFKPDLPIAAVPALSVTKEAILTKGHSPGNRRSRKGKSKLNAETFANGHARMQDSHANTPRFERSHADEARDFSDMTTSTYHPEGHRDYDCGGSAEVSDSENCEPVRIKNSFLEFGTIRPPPPSRSRSAPPR